MKNKYLIDFITKNNGDGMLLLSSYNRYWYTNIESSFAAIVVDKQGNSIYITDSRYFLAAKEALKDKQNFEVWSINQNPGNSFSDLIAKAIDKLAIKHLIIEEDYLCLEDLALIKKFDYIPVESSWLRSIKTPDEILKLQKAADIIVDVIKWVWTWIKPGYSEKEIAKKISIKILELGASGNSFDPIVAANKNGALPHHRPSDYVIQDGDMVTIDLGCMYDNYASDMTRTFVVGDHCNTKEMLDIYETVKQSQALGLLNAHEGQSTFAVDKVCRDFIANSKYNGLFNHGTGHGVGIQVHEKPVVSIGAKTILKKNEVITIEPGIYKENVGGVRIEDTIVINGNDPIILTNGITKELKYIKNY